MRKQEASEIVLLWLNQDSSEPDTSFPPKATVARNRASRAMYEGLALRSA